MNVISKFGAALALSLICATAAAQEGRGDVVYVPTPQVVVEEMLRMAKIGPDDFLIDLGSGDGRFVVTAAKKFGARGFGVDLDSHLLKLAREAAQKEGVADRARFVEQNLFETDLTQASVVSSYLLPEMNLKLRPKILALKPGTRVVAHDYHMGAWYPDDQRDIPVPGKKVGVEGMSYVYLWYVPVKVAGKWQAQASNALYDLSLEQLFQEVEGTIRLGSETVPIRGRIRNGDQITLTAVPKAGASQRHEFRGVVKGDVVDGTLRIGEGTTARQMPFSAKLAQRGEMRRASDDL